MPDNPRTDATAQLEVARILKRLIRQIQDHDTAPVKIEFTNSKTAARLLIGVCLHLLAAAFPSWTEAEKWLDDVADDALDALNNAEEEQ